MAVPSAVLPRRPPLRIVEIALAVLGIAAFGIVLGVTFVESPYFDRLVDSSIPLLAFFGTTGLLAFVILGRTLVDVGRALEAGRLRPSSLASFFARGVATVVAGAYVAVIVIWASLAVRYGPPSADGGGIAVGAVMLLGLLGIALAVLVLAVEGARTVLTGGF